MDVIEITIFKNIFQSISDEMGKILQYSAFSPNIKERKDFSCALFTAAGESFAFGTHIPVHLGAMPLSVKAALSEVAFQEGDMVILNDPYRGGTHLPDITLIAPVFQKGRIAFFIANRAHHSDVGGMQAGSMPLSSEIFQEGLIIPPVKLLKRNKPDEEIFNMILSNVRTPVERRGDLMAQIAANKRGIQRLEENIEKYGLHNIDNYSKFLIDYTEQLFKSLIAEIPDGNYYFEDLLDDDGFETRDILIKVCLKVKGDELVIDFSGSSPQVKGGINTNAAVTYSSVLYVLTTLLDEEIPINSGIMRPVKLVLPPDSIVNASKPSGLAGGNVETSQRIVDVLMGALSRAMPGRIPAASQGTMNNISFGGHGFAYYETLGGGAGAGPSYHGESGVHTNMTNSLNTPIEALEIDFPVEIKSYSIRKKSGGKGQFNGGDGLIRTYKFLKDAHVSILSERRRNPPYGLQGGEPGKPGENVLIKKPYQETQNNSLKKKRRIPLGSKANVEINAGDCLIIRTPGGGGYGKKE
ncbi:MAG: hydantoinase B/oxoprolinase family protein [Candidatus Aminicenantes bacterium]|nr:MAG: hydantoinase B/oxoprolinase family protein [Candidatus Aminicenantes bacterium]